MFINKGERYWRSIDIDNVEKTHNAKYINDLSIIDKTGDWSLIPVSVFYAYDPDTSKGHKHYFGLFRRDAKIIICDATSASLHSWPGMHILENDEVIFSRFNHDFRCSLLTDMNMNNEKYFFVDGGREYGRFGGDLAKVRRVDLKIVKDEMIVLDHKYGSNDILSDYEYTFKDNAYYIAILGFKERIEKFDNWLKEHTRSAKCENVQNWSYFNDTAMDTCDVVLKVTFDDDADKLMFKLKFEV